VATAVSGVETSPSVTGASGAAPSVGSALTERGAMRSRAMRGVGVWVVTHVVGQGLRVAATTILAALLSPAAFGIVALAQVVLGAARMFSETGVRLAVVRSDRDDEAFLNTAWTLQAIRGFVVWIAVAALAAPAAKLYGESALLLIIPILGVTSLLEGLESTRSFSLNRELREGPRAALMLAKSLVGRGSMVIWAIVAPSVWALVGGAIIGALFSVACSHTLLPGVKNRFRLERSAARELISFGAWVFVGSIIAFGASQLDRLLLGGLEAVAVLGVYAIAVTIARTPIEVQRSVAGQVAYPVLTEFARTDRERFEDRVRQVRSAVLPLNVATIVAVALLAPWFFELLYDDRYAAAMWIAPLAAVGTWFTLLNDTVNRSLLALGRTRALAISGLIKALAGAAGALVGFAFFGLPGFVLGLAAGDLGQHVMDVVVLRRNGVSVAAQDLRYMAIAAAFCAVGGGAVWASVRFGPEGSLGTALGLLVTAGAVGAAGLWSLRALLPILKEKRA